MRRAAASIAWAAAAVVLGATLSGCASAQPTAACVPELSVTPSDPRPGRIVSVETVRACPIDLPDGARYEVRIHPQDDRIPIARAYVTPDADGSFAVSITVPPTIRAGATVAEISNYWEYATCPDGASCAAAEVVFDVSE
ncbi:hypothetical protein ACIQLJ_06700 [Microbacterium sp. NPDC091313]